MLLQMIQQLCSKHWCAVPLLFLSQALSKLPPSPLLGIDGLTALRYLHHAHSWTVSYLAILKSKLVLTCGVSQGGTALHHDHSSSPAERCRSVLPAERLPQSHRRGKTQIVCIKLK